LQDPQGSTGNTKAHPQPGSTTEAVNPLNPQIISQPKQNKPDIRHPAGADLIPFLCQT
jgi:hypothetical protein